MTTATAAAKFRAALGLTQGEVGQLFQVHSQTVSNWERGVLDPTPLVETIMRRVLAKKTGLDALGKMLMTTLLDRGPLEAHIALLKSL